MDNLMNILSKLCVNKVNIDIKPNDMHELSVFNAVLAKTDFDQFDDILSIFKSMKRPQTTPSVQQLQPPKPQHPTPMKPPVREHVRIHANDIFLSNLLQHFGYDDTITLFMTHNDDGFHSKLNKAKLSFLSTLDKKLLKTMKCSEEDMQKTIAHPLQDGGHMLVQYMTCAKKMNAALKEDGEWKFFTECTDSNMFIKIDTNAFSTEEGFMVFKITVIKDMSKNLKRLLVKDLKDIAHHLEILTHTIVDGKKIPLHKQELIDAIERKLTST